MRNDADSFPTSVQTGNRSFPASISTPAPAPPRNGTAPFHQSVRCGNRGTVRIRRSVLFFASVQTPLFPDSGRIPERIQPVTAAHSGKSAFDDLSSNTLVREDFKEKRMRDASVDHLDFAGSGLKRGNGTADLREHSARKNAFRNQAFDF